MELKSPRTKKTHSAFKARIRIRPKRTLKLHSSLMNRIQHNSNLELFNTKYINEQIQARGYKAVLIEDINRIVNDSTRNDLLAQVRGISEARAKMIINKIMQSNNKREVSGIDIDNLW